MRPNLGYSNYYWINVERRKLEKFEPVVEDLPEATPIPSEEYKEEVAEEEEHTDFTEIVTEPPSDPIGTNPIMKIEPVMDYPRKDFKPLEEHTVLELRDICRERGIPQAGSKEELIAKIKLSQ